MNVSGDTGWRRLMRYNGVIQRKLALLSQQVLRLEGSLKEVSLIWLKTG
jgi:hypothetical protein